MNENPLVSVIVPSYNHEKFVQQSIESIINQSYKNIELIVIDDGSKDNSPKIIKELSDRYNFYFEVQNNIGLIPTQKKLISKCNGKYIASLASDDRWTLDKLEKQVKFMEGNQDIAASTGNILKINEDDEILPYYFQKFSDTKIFSFNDIITFKAFIPSISIMWRKSVIENMEIFDQRFLIDDLSMWLKLTYAGHKVVLLKDLMAFYRVHSSSLSKNSKVMRDGKLSY